MRHLYTKLVSLAFLFALAACSSTPIEDSNAPVVVGDIKKGSTGKVSGVKDHPEWERAPQGSGYYLDDGPGSHRPVDLQETPDPIPIVEPIVISKTKPYSALGQSFVPQQSLEEPYREEGRASWYGRKFHGAKTAIGEIYDMYQMTAAHPTLPLPSYARVTNLENDLSVIVRVNDRGPFLRGRIIDLSYAAALKLGYTEQGSAKVLVEKLTPDKIEELNSGTSNTKLVKNVKPVVSALPVERVSTVGMTGSDRPVVDSALSRPLAASDLAASAAPVSAAKDVAAQSLSVPSDSVVQTNKVAAAPQVKTLPEAPSGQVYLQLGAFGREGNASAVKADIQERFPEVGTVLKIHETAGLFRVMVGPFVSYDAARKVASKLSADGKYLPVLKEGLILP